MDKNTVKLIEKTLDAWSKKRNARSPNRTNFGISGCPLCLKFHSTYTDHEIHNSCRGCPISERTGRQFCISTPYESAQQAREEWKNGTGSKQDYQAACDAEIEFIASLLPTDSK